jgi:hypothetical protein
MEMTTGFGNNPAKNSPAAARNLKPPLPGRGVYGTDPRRQGYVAGEILRKQENLSNHRDAPLTAPVPFLKTRCTSGKGGQCKGAGSRLAPTIMSGQSQASKVQGLGPCDPARKKPGLSLDSRGPSHGSRDRKGAAAQRLVGDLGLPENTVSCVLGGEARMLRAAAIPLGNRL